MPLGFSPRGTIADFIRYNAMGAAGGTWSDRDHSDIAFVALMDLKNIQTCWCLFEQGSPPDIHFDVALGQPGLRPSKAHRRGLCLRMFFLEAGIGLREITSSNSGLCAAIDKIYSEFEVAPERAQELVPLVEQVDVVETDSSFGKIYDPVFAIVGWRPRPHELTPPTAPKARPAPAVISNDSLDDTIPF